MLRTRSLCLLALLALVVPAPSYVAADERPALRPLVPLRPMAKTGGRISADGLTSVVVVKYRDGVDALGAKAFEPAAAEIAAATVAGGVRPTFDRSVETLRAEEARLEAETGVDLADISLYVDVETASPRDAERLARSLERHDAVEFAYVRPAPVAPPAPAVAPARRGGDGPTPDFTALQYYLERAPSGFGVKPARALAGGRGEGIRIVDIEYSWNLDHEDLPFDESNPPFVKVLGGRVPFEDQGNHGTAALGMLVAADNGFGMTGICPDAEIGVVNPVDAAENYRLAQAIDFAANAVSRGDIIQIEQQARGVNNEIALLPSEWDPAVFDAIQRAVARGIVVVEPAGNGGIDKRGRERGISLDRKELGGAFDRKKKDSGAIMVGGGIPLDATTAPTSNYGTRIDVQGYGLGVATLGYGNLWGSDDRNRAYTLGWSGTSSATPCVTGAAAIVQATLKANGLAPLDCLLLRAVLAGTGTPDGSVKTKRIGPRPNADAAARGVADPAVPLITALKFVTKRDELVVDGVYFAGVAAPPESASVLYVNNQPVETVVEPGYVGPIGTATRLVARGVDALLVLGELSFIQVGTVAGPLSPRRVYVRKK